MGNGAPDLAAGIKILNGDQAGFVFYPLIPETSFGRNHGVNVFVPDLRSSRNHCHIRWTGSRYVVVDTSSNGTLLNGERLPKEQEVPLRDGAQIQIGQTLIEFRIAGSREEAPAGNYSPAPGPPPGAVEPPTMMHRLPPQQPPIDYVFDFEDDPSILEEIPGPSDSTIDNLSNYSTQRLPRIDPNELQPPTRP